MLQAPEVIEQSPDNIGFRKDGSGAASDGYDEAADIWSLGITAMEVGAEWGCGPGVYASSDWCGHPK